MRLPGIDHNHNLTLFGIKEGAEIMIKIRIMIKKGEMALSIGLATFWLRGV
jgi:hypothetical protein